MARSADSIRDLRDLGPVVAGMRDEVLEDHLLEVAVLAVDLGERLERGDPLLLGLADPDQDPARERESELARELDRLQPARGVLRRRAGVDGLHQPLGDRLQHQPLRGGDLAQAGQVLAREHPEVRVREQAPLERSLGTPRRHRR